MRAFEGDPKFEASQNLFDFPFARYAELLGLNGIRVDRPDQVADAWDKALGSDRPTIIEAITDPNVPPLPPNISFEQARNFTRSIIKGDPDALSIIKRSAEGMAKRIRPS
jgi:pyruvate dehydrogenase (quinone)